VEQPVITGLGLAWADLKKFLCKNLAFYDSLVLNYARVGHMNINELLICVRLAKMLSGQATADLLHDDIILIIALARS